MTNFSTFMTKLTDIMNDCHRGRLLLAQLKLADLSLIWQFNIMIALERKIIGLSVFCFICQKSFRRLYTYPCGFKKNCNTHHCLGRTIEQQKKKCLDKGDHIKLILVHISKVSGTFIHNSIM